jgi:heavy metal sensor kinase
MMQPRPARPEPRLYSFVRSIRFRLTLWSVGALGLILLGFSVFVYTMQAQQLAAQAQTQLEAKAQELELFFRLSARVEADSEDHHISFLTLQGMPYVGDRNFLALVGLDGTIQVTAGRLDQSALDVLAKERLQAGLSQAEVFITQPFPFNEARGRFVDTLFRVAPLPPETRLAGSIILGRPVDPDGQLPRLGMTLLLGSLAILSLVLAGGYWLAGRALSPVRTITRTARGIGETDLHRRLNLKTRDELGELAGTFDAMLDRLQAAFDRQRQFTADASHELRTPLTIVGLEAEQALERRRTVDEYERALKVIRSENEFMSGLVNDLLTLARMDAGQTALRLEALDLSDIVLEVTERLSRLARRGGVEIVLGDLPEAAVQGDRQYLSQMVANLVENAIKYAGGRGRHVRIETGRREAWAWVSVEDDGPGIPAEYLPHLFDRFYRVDKARTRQADQAQAGGVEKPPDGSGLGLSIVQWVARAHGGEVTVTSEVGKGARFEARLPLSKI